jgi:hypothetical protein
LFGAVSPAGLVVGRWYQAESLFCGSVPVPAQPHRAHYRYECEDEQGKCKPGKRWQVPDGTHATQVKISKPIADWPRWFVSAIRPPGARAARIRLARGLYMMGSNIAT